MNTSMEDRSTHGTFMTTVEAYCINCSSTIHHVHQSLKTISIYSLYCLWILLMCPCTWRYKNKGLSRIHLHIHNVHFTSTVALPIPHIKSCPMYVVIWLYTNTIVFNWISQLSPKQYKNHHHYVLLCQTRRQSFLSTSLRFTLNVIW